MVQRLCGNQIKLYGTIEERTKEENFDTFQKYMYICITMVEN